MYCPNCGNKNSEDQKFCRACGLGLEKIANSLAEQLPTKTHQSLQQQKEKLERLGVAALSVFGISVFTFLLYLMFQKLSVTQGTLIAALGVIVIAIVAGCGLLSVILFAKANELKETPAGRRGDEEAQLSPAPTTGKLLESHQQPGFSVTDRTTELLEAERLTKPKNH